MVKLNYKEWAMSHNELGSIRICLVRSELKIYQQWQRMWQVCGGGGVAA